MKRLLVLTLIAALCGCCNVNVCTTGEGETIEVTNSSLMFLGFCPLLSGDPEYPNRQVSVWFCDSLLLDVNMMLLDDALRSKGYRAFRNASTFTTRENVLLLFSRHTLHTSAELVR